MSDRAIPAFILARNNPTWTAASVLDLASAGLEPVIVDNNSTWGPMLEYLGSAECRVVRIRRDMHEASPYMLWLAHVKHSFLGPISLVEFFMRDVMKYEGYRYFVTDADLKMSLGPAFVDICNLVMDSTPEAIKVGPSLEWADHTEPYHEYEFLDEVISWESQFRSKLIGAFYHESKVPGEGGIEQYVQIFDAPIDTTLALYDLRRPYSPPNPGKGIRLDIDRTSVIHIPWTQPMSRILVNPEMLYMVMSCGRGVGSWTSRMKSMIRDRVLGINRIIKSTFDMEKDWGKPSEPWMENENSSISIESNIGNASFVLVPFDDGDDVLYRVDIS